MPPRKKKTKTPNVYEGKWTPLFEDVPTGMSLIDRAVYGFIVRMEQMDAKKSTASASTIGGAIGANEKTIDRTLTRLESWRVIRCVYRGKSKKEPSHYVSMPRSKWDENTINGAAQSKTEKRKLARVNLSSPRVNLSDDKGQFVQDKGQFDPQREDKRVSIRHPKRVSPNKKSKDKKKGSNSSSSPASSKLSPAPIRLSPDATHPPVARAPLPPKDKFLSVETWGTVPINGLFTVQSQKLFAVDDVVELVVKDDQAGSVYGQARLTKAIKPPVAGHYLNQFEAVRIK